MPPPNFDLYLITDRTLTQGRDLCAVVEQSLNAGARAIQLREKDLGGKELFELADKLSVLCQRYDAQLFINDRIDVALAVDAAGVQLGKNWKELEPRLETPSGEFGIISGGYNNALGLNPLVPGDDDGRISVDETRLSGAADFLVLGAVHEFIIFDPRVFDSTLRFLTSGYFLSAEKRQPISQAPVAVGSIRRPQ